MELWGLDIPECNVVDILPHFEMLGTRAAERANLDLGLALGVEHRMRHAIWTRDRTAEPTARAHRRLAVNAEDHTTFHAGIRRLVRQARGWVLEVNLDAAKSALVLRLSWGRWCVVVQTHRRRDLVRSREAVVADADVRFARVVVDQMRATLCARDYVAAAALPAAIRLSVFEGVGAPHAVLDVLNAVKIRECFEARPMDDLAALQALRRLCRGWLRADAAIVVLDEERDEQCYEGGRCGLGSTVWRECSSSSGRQPCRYRRQQT